MRELILPLVVIGLVATAVIARRVLRPPLSGLITTAAALIVPWVRGANFFMPIRVQIEPATSFGALPDGQPIEIAVQVYRGDRLLEERRIPGLGQAVQPPKREPLRLVPLESSGGYRVMAGSVSLGELSSDALADAGVGSDGVVAAELLPDVSGPPPEATPELDPTLDPAVARADVAAKGDPIPAARPPASPHTQTARKTSTRPPPSEPDRELESRCRWRGGH